MENEEMLEQTNESENVDTQATEENEEGIELTDTAETSQEVVEEKKEEAKTLRELLKEHPEYQEEFNGMVKNRLDRKDREYQKEISKHKNLEEVVKKGLGVESIDDAERRLREFYKGEGIEMPEPTKPGLTDREVQILAKEEAREIIESGDAESEANQLASKGYQNLNTREKALFNTLAEHLTREKKKTELKTLGVNSEILDSKEFTEFASKFNSNVNIKDIYELFEKTSGEKKQFKKMGSMKSNTSTEEKTEYTPEEVDRLTEKDLDNPVIFERVRKSMLKW